MRVQMCVRNVRVLWLLVSGNSSPRCDEDATAGRVDSSVRLFQVVEVLHQLLVVHAEIQVIELDGVTVLAFLLIGGRRSGGGRWIEGEHRISDYRRSFHVHRPPVTCLHE